MRVQVEGSKAVAGAVAACRPNVVCAYPITPQTHIVEALGVMVASGELPACRFLNVESEFAALSVAIGASATGARAYTATASQGLLFMAEAVYNVGGLGLPIVMTLANRAIGAPINIWNDHSDAMAVRDAGWVQLFAADNQQAADLHVVGFRLAEELSVPVMVCMDGFVLTHATEAVDVPEQDQVARYLPAYEPRQVLDPDHPMTIGAMVGPDAYEEVRYLAHARMLEALELVPALSHEFEDVFGRAPGSLVSPHRLHGARVAIVAMGSVLGTLAEAVDTLRLTDGRVGVPWGHHLQTLPDRCRPVRARARRAGGRHRPGHLRWVRRRARRRRGTCPERLRRAGPLGDRRAGWPAGDRALAAPHRRGGARRRAGPGELPRPGRGPREGGDLASRLHAPLGTDGRERPPPPLCGASWSATMTTRGRVRYYQVGSFAVGNRLLPEAQRTVQADCNRPNGLTVGHRACQGCGEALAARYVVDAALRATDGRLIAVNATGCLEVFTTPYPESSWQLPWLHSLFGNAAAVAAGAAAALAALGRADVRVIAQAGDGGTVDIGLGCLSGMFERNDDVLFVCYDNEAYMNTGVQRSGATPPAARTATTEVVGSGIGNPFGMGKDVPAIAMAHGVAYVATATVADLHDLEDKVDRAMSLRGARYLHVLVPCPLGWGSQPADTVHVARLAQECGLFCVYEAEHGVVTAAQHLRHRVPVEEYLRTQSRFRHLFAPDGSVARPDVVAALQAQADANIDRLGVGDATRASAAVEAGAAP